jgi:hypothetical protein
MGPVIQFLKDDAAFDQADIDAMSTVLQEVCKALDIKSHSNAREIIAIRIIELARRGERNPLKLPDRVVAEAQGNTGCWPACACSQGGSLPVARSP